MSHRKEIITSPGNVTLKLIKSLKMKKYRDKHGLYIVEGIKMIKEALNHKDNIHTLIFSQDFYLEELFPNEEDCLIPNISVDSDLFKAISDVESPQGIMAILKKQDHLLDIIFKTKSGFWVILDRIQDPGNMGTIIRTVDAVGASGVILLEGCVDPYNPKTIRSTMGSIFRVPIVQIQNSRNFLDRFVKSNGDLLVSSMEGINIFNWEGNETDDLTALVIGNESKGVSDEVRQFATRIISIPIVGDAESLNASVAAGIMIYEIMRKKGNIG